MSLRTLAWRLAAGLAVFLAAAGPAAAELVYEIDLADEEGTFRHPFNIVNAFWPKDVAADYKSRHPFVRYYAFFNAFGGNPNLPQHELYDEDADGNPVYHFERLAAHIDTVVAAGLKPYLVLGGCPVKLARDPAAVSSAYGTMTCGPHDYDKYREFVRAFFEYLDGRYGAQEVASWRYRFMTEPDNTQWWTDSREEWFKFYDYTVSGARAANPQVRISPANLMRHSEPYHSQWLVPYAERVHNGVFAVPGESPYVPERLTFSFYSPWRVNQSGGPQVMEVDSGSIRAALAPYPEFDGIPLGIDEGYVGTDENYKTLWARVDGTEWGAAHFAYLVQVMMDNNWDHCALWDPGDPDCPQPMRNVLDLMDEMNGMKKLSARLTSGAAPAGFHPSVLAAKEGERLRLMLAYYNSSRTATGSIDFRLVLTGLSPGTVAVRRRLIDHDHGNYRTQWLVDSAGYPRQGDNSPYDMPPLAGLWSNQEAVNLWNANLPTYRALAADMDLGVQEHQVGDDGRLELSVTLPVHGVAFLDIKPPLRIVTQSLGPWYEGLTIGLPVTVETENASGPLSFSSPDLPAGLSLDAATGVISGTPAVHGDLTFSIQVTDGVESDSRTYSTHIHSAVTGLELSAHDVLLEPGWQEPLTAVVHFQADPDVVVNDISLWTSDDEAVVTVTAPPEQPAGVLGAQAEGEAVVTCALDLTPYGGSLLYDTVQVRVVADATVPAVDAAVAVLSGTAHDGTAVRVTVDGTPVAAGGGGWTGPEVALAAGNTTVLVEAADPGGRQTRVAVEISR